MVGFLALVGIIGAGIIFVVKPLMKAVNGLKGSAQGVADAANERTRETNEVIDSLVK
jgi:hypothetical protein